MFNLSNRVLLNFSDHGVATVTLNRPDKRNALDFEMFKALVKAQKMIKKDKTVRVVVLTATGEDFCSGLDTKSVMQRPINALRLLFKWLPGNANLAQQVTLGWRRLSVPVIAAIHGRCWGGGMQIALGADFRLASRDASLSIMESKWGLIPDMGGNKVLSQLMPLDQAMKLAMLGETLSASDAYNVGLITKICDDLENDIEQFSLQFLGRSPDVLSSIKHLYIKTWHRSERTMLARETGLQIRVLSSPNQKIASRLARGERAAFKTRRVK